jgi:SAM-dependent methyltransferase
MSRTQDQRRGTFELDTGRLQAVYPGVWDHLEGRGQRLPGGDELAVARWLRSHFEAIDAYLSHGRDSPLPAEVVDSQAWRTVAGLGDFSQIWHDFRIMIGGDPLAGYSETIDFTQRVAEVYSSSRVLEIGCSLGRHLMVALAQGAQQAVGVDIDLFALVMGAVATGNQQHDERIARICADARELPFRDSRFTHVHSFATLAWLPTRQALAEARRVLVPGGRLVLTVEGSGYWQFLLDRSRSNARSRLARLRERVGSRLIRHGLDWQGHPVLRRLAGHVHFEPETIRRILTSGGFAVDRCEVLRTYRGRPWIVALAARKQGSSRTEPVSAARVGRGLVEGH